MKTELVQAIRLNTENLFQNANICLQTCDMDFILCDMPVWKHAYHMLHSCDQWFINPNEYEEPPFHVPNLNSLDVSSEKVCRARNCCNTLTPSGARSSRIWTVSQTTCCMRSRRAARTTAWR